MEQKPNILLFFPAYNDEDTIRAVTEKSWKVLSKIANKFEILIIDDGSPDRTGEVADELAQEFSEVSVIHHEKNKGYGCALQTGFNYPCTHEWICFTDGDDEYDVRELYHMATLLHRYDMLISFRYEKAYSTWRMFVSYIYNKILRFIFRSPYRDISSGLKLVRREVIENISITSSSPFVGAEIVLKATLKGYFIGEVGISTYPRKFGVSTSTSVPNIIGTIKDMLRVRGEIFKNEPRQRVWPK